MHKGGFACRRSFFVSGSKTRRILERNRPIRAPLGGIALRRRNCEKRSMTREMGGEAPKKSNRGTKIAIGCLIAVPALVCLIGVCSATAIPAFLRYTRRSKSAEASMQLRMLAEGVRAYYDEERVGAGGAITTRCVVAPGSVGRPSPERTMPTPDPSFTALGWAAADPTYYRYELDTGGSRCGVGPGPLLTIRAFGDLDGDGVLSTFELPMSVDASGEVRQGALFTNDELE